MNMRIIFRHALLGCGLLVASQIVFSQTAIAMQGQEDGARSNQSFSLTNNGKSGTPSNKTNISKPESTSARAVDEVPVDNLQKINTDKITSFFVRANDSKRIQLSMLVAHKEELTDAVRKIFGQKLTPLVFSVSTLPNRSVNFDPNLLRFEQRGRVWQPLVEKNTVDIMPLDENTKFGGMVTDGEVHQGIVLLPAWFNPKEPITLRYGDFHYLARFANLSANEQSIEAAPKTKKD